MIKPNTAYVIPFETTAAGIATAADSTPTAVLWRNGSAEVTAVVIVTTANTGIYHASFTTDAGWAATDRIWLVVSATIDGEAYTGIAWDSFAESDSKGDIAEAVAQYDQRDEDGTPGTIGWYFKKLRQANNTVEAVVTNDITPTDTTFSVALTTYPTGAFKHSVLAVVEDGAILDQNSPILTFTNNTTYSTIVLEEAFTQAPAVGNVLLINVVSHVHSVASIAAGVWETLTSTLNTVGSTGRALARLIGLVEDSGGDRFTAKAVELTQPANVGDWSITRTFQVSGGDKVSGVRMSLVGVAGKTDTTGTNGIATIKADDGTLTLRVVVPAGYEDVADTTVTINGADSTATVTLVATAVTPASPPLCTVVLPVVDQYGAAIAGVSVMIEFVSFNDTADPDAVVMSPPPVLTSDENGQVAVDLLRLANYKATYAISGSVKRVDFLVPDAGSYVVVEPN